MYKVNHPGKKNSEFISINQDCFVSQYGHKYKNWEAVAVAVAVAVANTMIICFSSGPILSVQIVENE